MRGGSYPGWHHGKVAAVLALLASLTYGAADFLGGLMGRRIPVTVLILWSQAVSLVLALIAALMFPADRVTQADIGWGAFAGAAGIIGIYFLYQGLAQGRMAVVSPVAAWLARSSRWASASQWEIDL